jgi:hypothetical protein
VVKEDLVPNLKTKVVKKLDPMTTDLVEMPKGEEFNIKWPKKNTHSTSKRRWKRMKRLTPREKSSK